MSRYAPINAIILKRRHLAPINVIILKRRHLSHTAVQRVKLPSSLEMWRPFCFGLTVFLKHLSGDKRG